MSVIDPSVEVVIGGNKYKLLLNMLAIYHFKQVTGKEILDMLEGAINEQSQMVETAALLWAGTQRHSVNIRNALSFDEFLELINPETLADADIQNALAQALRAALPKPKKENDDTDSVESELMQSESKRLEGGQNG